MEEVARERGQSPQENIYELAEKLDFHMNEGLPVNRLADLVAKEVTLDSAEPTFHSIVDSLELTDKEKQVLHSIVTKQKAGTLTVLDRETREELLEVRIPQEITRRQKPERDVSILLIPQLTKFLGQPIEISFEK